MLYCPFAGLTFLLNGVDLVGLGILELITEHPLVDPILDFIVTFPESFLGVHFKLFYFAAF
jgi:hypothetical protein